MTELPVVTKLPDGSRTWHFNDKLHREDGPAIELADGTREWYFNGKRHREDGPAVKRANGNRMWYFNGKRHREDGPAVELADGTREWYIYDVMMSFRGYVNKIFPKNTPEKCLFLLKWSGKKSPHE